MISCDGEAGASGYLSGGGGGSGGSILLSAGGLVRIDGRLSVQGGDGGRRKAPNARPMSDHGGAGSGGRVAIFGQSASLGKDAVLLGGGDCGATSIRNVCTGGNGTLYVNATLDAEVTVDQNRGAAGTRSSLRLMPRNTPSPFNPKAHIRQSRSGPELDLGSLLRPERVVFYLRVEPALASPWDGSVELREARWSYLTSQTTLNYTSVIGFVAGRNELRHGTNYFAMPFDDDHVEKMSYLTTIEDARWYKIDLRFNWETSTHDVFLDDIRIVFNSPFQGEGIRSIALGNFYEGGSLVSREYNEFQLSHLTMPQWIDEIYVGRDTTMEFRCPVADAVAGELRMNRPREQGWLPGEIGRRTCLATAEAGLTVFWRKNRGGGRHDKHSQAYGAPRVSCIKAGYVSTGRQQVRRPI